MARSGLESEIQSRIETLATELANLVRKEAMASIQAALGGNGSTTRRRGPGRPKGSMRKKRRGRPGRPARPPSAATEALVPRVLAHVKANDGAGVSDIAKALKKSSDAVKPAVARLLAEKKLRKTGQRRGTKYHVRG